MSWPEAFVMVIAIIAGLVVAIMFLDFLFNGSRRR